MDIYPVPLPAGYSSVSSSFYIAVFGVAFLYSDSLWSFFIVEFLYSGSLWSFFIVEFPVGGVVSVACQGFLVREACC